MNRKGHPAKSVVVGATLAGTSSNLGIAMLLVLLAGCVSSEPRLVPRAPSRVETRIFDEFGRSLPDKPLPSAVAPPPTFDPLTAMAEQPQDPPPKVGATPQDPTAARAREAELRTRFGPAVLIRGDLLTKRYFLSGETSNVFLSLLRKPGELAKAPTAEPFGGKKSGEKMGVLEGMLGDHVVELSYFQDFEPVSDLTIAAVPGGKGSIWPVPRSNPKNSNSLLLVTAKAEALGAFEDALNLFFANVPQVEITVKVVEWSTTDSLSFGVNFTGDPDKPDPTFKSLGTRQLVKELSSSFPLTAPFVGVTNISDKASLLLGGIHDDWQLSARLEALEAQGKVDVLSSPKVVVRNGGTASILTQTDFPFPKAKISSSGQNVTSDIEFKPVGINLGICPVIAGTETVILQVFADVSAVTSFAATEPVPTPIVSRRQAVTSVHVPSGKTTMIGGLKTRSTVETESKVPILGDIPILGYLFRSSSTSTSDTELTFFITPRIIRGTQGALLGE